jgi:hypothetical protein
MCKTRQVRMHAKMPLHALFYLGSRFNKDLSQIDNCFQIQPPVEHEPSDLTANINMQNNALAKPTQSR